MRHVFERSVFVHCAFLQGFSGKHEIIKVCVPSVSLTEHLHASQVRMCSEITHPGCLEIANCTMHKHNMHLNTPQNKLHPDTHCAPQHVHKYAYTKYSGRLCLMHQCTSAQIHLLLNTHLCTHTHSYTHIQCGASLVGFLLCHSVPVTFVSP